MRKLPLLTALLMFAVHAGAASPVDLTKWRSGLVELDEGWAEHDGDNAAWAQPSFDDSGWQTVDIEDLGHAQPGWRWYRKHVNVGADYPDVQFLLDGGEGVYELYVNGERVPGPAILSQFAVNRPKERVFKLHNDNGDFEIALRTYAPTIYCVYQFPLFDSVTMGRPTVIEYERQTLESDRLYAVPHSLAINLLLVLAAIAALALYVSQRMQRDYLFLGLFLLLQGISQGLWHLQQAGVVPISANFLVADPLVYIISIAQIEFTFSFARRRVGKGWRIYEAVLLLPLLLIPPMWMGHFSTDTYNLLQALVTAPIALLLPVLLFTWYRHGNREAGWLIFPSLLPTAAGVLYDLGLASVDLGWKRFDFLIDPIPVGPIPIQASDIGSFLFLLAIGFVMFFRFTRVSREQARSAAELDAAREIQRRLVPPCLPPVPGYRIEAAYQPAQEVGGDFYQVLAQPGGATLVIVGDVSGKGLRAAMTGMLAIGALRTLASEGHSPAALLTRLNRQIIAAEDGGFVTCLCAHITADGEVTVANAGHLAPYRNGREVEIDSGLPLGLADDATYVETAFRLAPADSMTLLSDGVLEARNAGRELFGFTRTQEISSQSAENIAAIAQDYGQEDDITVLTVARMATAIA